MMFFLALRQAEYRLADLSGTVAALEDGLNEDSYGNPVLRNYCAGLRLVVGSIDEVREMLAALLAA